MGILEEKLSFFKISNYLEICNVGYSHPKGELSDSVYETRISVALGVASEKYLDFLLEDLSHNQTYLNVIERERLRNMILSSYTGISSDSIKQERDNYILSAPNFLNMALKGLTVDQVSFSFKHSFASRKCTCGNCKVGLHLSILEDEKLVSPHSKIFEWMISSDDIFLARRSGKPLGYLSGFGLESVLDLQDGLIKLILFQEEGVISSSLCFEQYIPSLYRISFSLQDLLNFFRPQLRS